MTLPLPANWASGNSFTHTAENNAETVVNGLGAGTLVIPKRVSTSSAGTLTLTTAYNRYVFTGTTSTWTMPAVSGHTGSELILYNRGTGTVTVNRAGSDQLLLPGGIAATTIALLRGGAARFVCDGTYWINIQKGSGSSDYPTFDAASSAVIGASPTTWSHTVGTGHMGAIIVVRGGESALYGQDPADVTGAAATIGGVTCRSVGYHLSAATWSWYWLFFGSEIPSGSQTVSLAGTFRSGFTAYCYSYFDAGFCAPYLVGFSGIYSMPYNSQWGWTVQTRRSSHGPGLLFFAADAADAIDSASPTPRTGTTGSQFFGDQGITGGEKPGAGWHTVGQKSHTVALEVLTDTPTEPYVNTVGPGGTSSWTHNAPAGSYGVVAAVGSPTGATWDGSSMTELGTYTISSGRTVKLYGKAGVSTGAKTVAITGSAVAANSLTISNVTSVATAQIDTDSSITYFRQTVTCAPGHLVLQVVGCDAGGLSAGALTNAEPHWYNATDLTINQTYAPHTFLVTTIINAGWAGIAVEIS